jgi:hypothetical protein
LRARNPNRSTYSHAFFVDTPRGSRYTAHLRHATIFVLADASAVSTWRPSEGGRCSGSGRWYELLVNNRHWALVLNHCRAMLLAPGPPLAASTGGWHLSPNLRPSYLSSSTDCALFGSSELGLRAAARSYPELWAFTAKVFMGCICDVIHCLLWSSRSHSH